MISAAKYFEATKDRSKSNEDDDRFSRWNKRSPSTWLVDHNNNGNKQPPSDHNQHNQHNQDKTNGEKEEEDWIVELESYLKTEASSSSAAGTTAANELRQNRHGLAVSAALRLCSRTLTKSILTPIPGGSYCIAGLVPGGTQSKPLEFYYYRGTSNNNHAYVTPEVPPGYEELEIPMARIQEEKKEERQQQQQQQDQIDAASSVYYLMEIQHRACRTSSKSTQTKATLDEIGLIWNDDGDSTRDDNNNNNNNTNGKRPSYLSTTTTRGKAHCQQSTNSSNWNTTSAEGIKVKIISSRTLRQILNQQSRNNSQDDDDLSWILTKLEEADPLTLPQPVGGGDVGSSLLLLVSLDPVTAAAAAAATARHRRHNQHHHPHHCEKTTINAHLVLKFHRTERTKNPLSNQLSATDCVIGRQIQVVHHPSSEEEDIQRALHAAMCNAERFIPEWKRQQWENVADVLIMVLPHPALPDNIASWLRSPAIRMSQFDLAFSNVLLHLPYGQQWYPPLTYYVDKAVTVPLPVWNDVWIVHENISRMVANVRANAMYHRVDRNGDASIINGLSLYNLCRDLETGRFAFQKTLTARLEHCAPIQLGYLSRMMTALIIERLRCFEDMKKHDMYSIHWKDHVVEIPPPMQLRLTCPGCNPNARRGMSLCPYHLAQLHVQEETGRTPVPGKPIAIRTKKQLERLPLLLWEMLPGESLVVKIHVPGVAEDFPLVSIGDLVRLFFRSPGQQGMSTEVVAEVVDVVVKTEIVTIRLPSPLQSQNGRPCTTPGCLPYLQALLHTKDYVLDAQPILNGSRTNHEARQLEEHNRKAMMDKFRFDIRFGFQGGRGFDIIEQVLGEFFAPAIRQRSTSSATMRRTNSKNKEIDNPKTRKLIHLHRVLAPTRRLLEGMVFTNFREDRVREDAVHQPLNYVTPLNQEQRRAVEDIVYNYHGQALYIIDGPAGTGKSMCVCEAIVQVLRTAIKPKVLVCAPSDAACDVIASRLLPLLPPQSLLRINWWSRKVASVKPELLSSCPMDLVGGSFTIPRLEELREADVIVCQCFVAECLELAGRRGWTQDHFTHLFIDETSQAMECEALVPIAKVGCECSIVLAGDPKQLGPTVRDPVAAKMGLGVSIQERLLSLPIYAEKHYCVKTRLVKNYRSNEALLTVPSSLFYNKSLKAMAPDEVAEPFVDLGELGPAGFPLLLCNVHDGLECSKLDTPSFYNIEECNAVVSLASGLLRCRTKEGVQPLHTGQICVITPFRAQVLALRTILRASNLGGINVGVVEDFQGQEAKVVLISTVLTRDHQRWNRKDCKGDDPGQRLGFLHDPKRFNVAITRAHALCIIVGCANYLEQSGTYWAALMDHIQRNDGVLGEEFDNEEYMEHENGDDRYGVSDLLRRVGELKLLGSGAEQDQYDLSYYYSDNPQWKVMLS